jgi:hypothetical protein
LLLKHNLQSTKALHRNLRVLASEHFGAEDCRAQRDNTKPGLGLQVLNISEKNFPVCKKNHFDCYHCDMYYRLASDPEGQACPERVRRHRAEEETA